MTAHLVSIGVIRKPVGVNGLCGVEMFGNSLLNLKLPKVLLAGPTETECNSILLERIELRLKGPACGFSGINDMDSAEALRGFYIFINSTDLPQLEGNTYYQFELVGLKVQTDSGKEVGSVLSVHNFPTVDCIEVSRGNSDTLMIPLVMDSIIEIDQKSGYLTIRNSFIEDLL